jgi:proliferating cell nuclear antigen
MEGQIMFKATIDAHKLIECVDALRTLVLEAKFVLTPEAMSVNAVDPANVAMVNLDLPSAAFSSYEATEAELGIDLRKLGDILDMAAKDEVLGLELDETQHRLVVRMRGLAYTMSLLDPSSIRKGPKMPALQLPGLAVIHGDNFKRGMKAAGKVSDYVSVGITGETFFIEGSGDVDSVRFELDRGQLLELKSSEVKALFSLDYLNDISKIAGKAENVTLEMGNDLPIKISHSIANDDGNVVYIAAPRVESD